jgi:hypothetical protein
MSASTVLRRLIGRMQEGEKEVSGWGAETLDGHAVAQGAVPCQGLAASLVEPLRSKVQDAVPGLEFVATIAGRRSVLRFWLPSGTPSPLAWTQRFRAYARVCFVWLVMLLPCSTDRAGSKGFVCDLVMLPDRRRFPEGDDLVGPVHCNGGISYVGREAARFCVYREEEWFKVFVHETFHAFGVHGEFPEQSEVQERLGFSGRLVLECSEVYAEAWARIIAVLFSLGLSPTVTQFRRGLEQEAAHGWRNCLQVLARVSAHEVTKQPTPAFEYYCLAGIVMVNHVEFIEWCVNQNRACGGGVGFELRNPRAWLGWLGRISRGGLGRAGYLLANGTAMQEGESARMTRAATSVPPEIDS